MKMIWALMLTTGVLAGCAGQPDDVLPSLPAVATPTMATQDI